MSDFEVQNILDRYLTPDEKFILACSTGADSMFLLYKILETDYKNNMIVCYFNHNTREQCKLEEDFLVAFGKEKGFEVEIGDCDFEKIKKLYPSKSFEELAREKRYQFFDALCHIHGAKKVLTAHHLDDRIETMLFHMLRGTKLTGLINMTELSGNMIRPLLGLEKSEILSYLEENNLTYFEDETNKDSKYTRNYMRKEILPLFSQVHPEHKKNLQHLLSYFEEIKNHLDAEVFQFLTSQNTQNSFSLKIFLTLSPLLQKEIIRAIYYTSNNHSTIGLSEANISEVIRFLKGKNNKTKKEIGNLKMFKNGDTIYY